MALTSPGVIKAANEALAVALPEINIAREFAADFSAEFAEPGLTVKVPLVNAGTAETFDGDSTSADYEHNTGSIEYATVALDTHKKVTFALKDMDALEAPNAPYWATCAKAGGEAVAAAISSAVGGLFTVGDGGNIPSANSVVIGTAANLTLKAIAKLRVDAAKKARIADTVLALDGEYYATLMGVLGSNYAGGDTALAGHIPGLFGFKSVVCLRDLPASTTVKGALIPANAIAIAGRAVPCDDPGLYSEFGTVSDPQSGLTLTVRRHGSARMGKNFLNVEALFGAKVLKSTNNETKIQVLTAS